MENKKHILSLRVRNNFGTLTHVAALFSRRGYNIESLSVGETQDKRFSVITLVVKEEEKKIHQIINQLAKLMDVIEIINLNGVQNYKRELVLIKVAASEKKRSEIIHLVNAFSANIIDITKEAMLIELISYPHKIDAIIQLLKEYTILEIARTGTIAISYSSN